MFEPKVFGSKCTALKKVLASATLLGLRRRPMVWHPVRCAHTALPYYAPGWSHSLYASLVVTSIYRLLSLVSVNRQHAFCHCGSHIKSIFNSFPLWTTYHYRYLQNHFSGKNCSGLWQGYIGVYYNLCYHRYITTASRVTVSFGRPNDHKCCDNNLLMVAFRWDVVSICLETTIR